MDLLLNATKEELLAVPEIGKRLPESIIHYASEEQNRRLIERLEQAGLQMAWLFQNERKQKFYRWPGRLLLTGTLTTLTRRRPKRLFDVWGKPGSAVSVTPTMWWWVKNRFQIPKGSRS